MFRRATVCPPYGVCADLEALVEEPFPHGHGKPTEGARAIEQCRDLVAGKEKQAIEGRPMRLLPRQYAAHQPMAREQLVRPNAADRPQERTSKDVGGV